MKSTPDQHDPDWPRYPETVLNFDTKPPLSIDLRSVISRHQLAQLAKAGLGEPFAVMTAFDPRGQNLSREENDERARKLEGRLRRMGHEFLKVDACSPDGAHCECSVAVKMPKEKAVELARQLEQVAIFWFDGKCFWIVGAIVETDPGMLPRNS